MPAVPESAFGTKDLDQSRESLALLPADRKYAREGERERERKRERGRERTRAHAINANTATAQCEDRVLDVPASGKQGSIGGPFKTLQSSHVPSRLKPLRRAPLRCVKGYLTHKKRMRPARSLREARETTPDDEPVVRATHANLLYRGSSLIRPPPPPGPCSRTMPRSLW